MDTGFSAINFRKNLKVLGNFGLHLSNVALKYIKVIL